MNTFYQTLQLYADFLQTVRDPFKITQYDLIRRHDWSKITEFYLFIGDRRSVRK